MLYSRLKCDIMITMRRNEEDFLMTKRITRISLITFLGLLSVLLLMSCNVGSSSDTTVAESSDTITENALLQIIDGGVTEYTVVRGDRAPQWEIDCAASLASRFKELTGIQIKIKTDWKGDAVSEKEIIVGTTEREGDLFSFDRASIGRGGYVIMVVDSKIFIIGKDSKGLNAAVDHFISLLESNFDMGKNKLSIDKEYSFMTEKSESTFAPGEKINYTDVKAMWLSQFDFTKIYSSGGKQREKSSYISLIDTALDNCLSIGINTVIVQVRPNADSFYPSEFYAPSTYVVGSYGKDFEYDPFEILIEKAHERGLSVHAWINPMRAMTSTEIEKIDSSYQLSKWWNDPTLKDKYLPVVSGRVYLNVGYAEVRELIVNGASEIVRNYDVDGLHMDDYFYPTTDASFDSSAYRENGHGLSLGDFRRDALNTLVSDIYSAVKEVNKNILFGISPAGTMEKDYESLYADVYTWCKDEGYIDYICPQLYFGMEHATCAFDTLAIKWNNIIKNENVKMWIGMTLGKAVSGAQGTGDQWAGSGKNEWIENKDILKRCLEYTKNADKCTGVAYFCYQYFWNPTSGAENSHTKEERNNFLPVLEEISW